MILARNRSNWNRHDLVPHPWREIMAIPLTHPFKREGPSGSCNGLRLVVVSGGQGRLVTCIARQIGTLTENYRTGLPHTSQSEAIASETFATSINFEL